MTEIPPTTPEEIKKFLAEAAGASELYVRNLMDKLHGNVPQDDQDPANTESYQTWMEEVPETREEDLLKAGIDKVLDDSEAAEQKLLFDLKLTSEIPLTPEQMQAQQDLYDQMQAPTTEIVDFEADREAYLARHQTTSDESIVVVSDLSEDEKRVIVQNIVQKVTEDSVLGEPTTEVVFGKEPPEPKMVN
jgi:hypothetical protein